LGGYAKKKQSQQREGSAFLKFAYKPAAVLTYLPAEKVEGKRVRGGSTMKTIKKAEKFKSS